VALVAFAVVRGILRVFRGTVEMNAGGSWGRQVTNREKTSGDEMS
jgi:hypothetical protein